MNRKSFFRTFFKKFVGFSGNAPDGIFKGKALKFPKKIQNLRKQILTIKGEIAIKNKILLPESVSWIIDTLLEKGYQAYAVGGCVRDCLMGNIPHDWDICTNALPDEVKKIFRGEKIVETGIKHGTVTLIKEHMPFEITTFRSESTYSDNRHPDSVVFEKNVNADLSRRDFTVNAIAYNPYDGFIDLYDGVNDIENRTIKAVGNSDERFKEDALRILRALRFASVLGFTIDEDTSSSVHNNKELLHNIAVERIWTEFCKLLMGKNAVNILRDYVDVISVFMPEIALMVGFDQHNPHHCYDVWEHTLHALSYAESDIVVRLAVLFHDCGKPCTFTTDDNSIGHFYAHAQKSCEMAGQIFSRLKTDNYTKNTVLTLIKYHNRMIEPTEKSVKKAVRKLGNAEVFEKLLKVKSCDVQAQAEPFVQSRLQTLQQILQIYRKSKNDDSLIFSVKNLAINGKDIMALGVKQGKEIGHILNILLESVLDGKIENNRDTLIKKVSEIISN